MPEELKHETTPVIRYEGVVDWNELYDFITGWLSKKKFDFYEIKNIKKIATYGYERDYEAHAEREESGYVRHDIEVCIRMQHGEDFEVNVNGHKKMKTKVGMLVIEIKPSVKFDWQKKWDKGFKEKARIFFHKYIVKGFALEQMDKIYYDAYKLQTGIKEQLDMESKYSAYM